MTEENDSMATALEQPPTRSVIGHVTLQEAMRRMGKPDFLFLDDLHVDRRYQPEHRQRTSRIRPMAESWDHMMAESLVVSLRDGLYWIVDGATRHAAAVLRRETIADDIFGFNCVVHTDLTLGDEARLFRRLNGQRLQVHVVDRYNAALLEGDAVALAMRKSLSAYRLKIGYTPTATDISAVQSVEHLHLWGVLDSTLAVLEETWPGTPAAHARDVLLGVGAFLYVYREREIEHGHLVDTLPADPPRLLDLADYVSQDSYHGKSYWAQVAAAIREGYVKGRGHRLPTFSQPYLPRAASSISGRR